MRKPNNTRQQKLTELRSSERGDEKSLEQKFLQASSRAKFARPRHGWKADQRESDVKPGKVTNTEEMVVNIKKKKDI